jgi:hypothetical protein
MNMNQLKNNIVSLKAEEFEEKPGLFCMSYGFDSKKITSSIAQVGLINRPYVRRNRSGTIDIITGYRRITACRELNWKIIPCIDLSDAGLSDADLLILNLYDNICVREFNNIEKYMIIKKLLSYFSMSNIYERFMPFLGVSSRREIDLLLKIEGLTDELKGYIAKGLLSIKALELLKEIKDYDLPIITKFITELHLNFNQQILFIEYINDISIREGLDVSSLLNGKTFIELLDDASQNIPQRAKTLLDRLRIKRFPILVKNEKAFAKLILEVDLPPNVRIKHTPFFEGPDYVLEISFKDGKKLKETINRLTHAKGIEKINDPWTA